MNEPVAIQAAMMYARAGQDEVLFLLQKVTRRHLAGCMINTSNRFLICQV